jgi:hypothetical protein
MLLLAISKFSKDSDRKGEGFRELVINELSAIFEEYLWYIDEPRISISSVSSV